MRKPKPSIRSLRQWYSYILISIGISFFVLLTALALNKIERVARTNAVSTLQTVLNTSQEGLNLWQQDITQQIQSWAAMPVTIQLTEAQLAIPRTAEALVSSSQQDAMRALYLDLISIYEGEGIFIIAPDYTNIVSMRDENVGMLNLMVLDYEAELVRSFSGETVFIGPLPSDVSLQLQNGEFADNVPTMFIVTPIQNHTDKSIALLAIRLDPQRIFTRIALSGRIGATGETYIFDKHGSLLSASRFRDQLIVANYISPYQTDVFNVEMRDPNRNILEEPFSELVSHEDLENFSLTVMAASATKGGEGKSLGGYNDYRGVRVLGAWTWNTTFNVGIATEIDEVEALETYTQARNIIWLFFTGLSAGLLIVYYIFSNLMLRIKSAEKMATEDALTKIANRRFFNERLKEEWGINIQTGQSLSVLFLDIDYFKEYNDRYGHPAGDLVLQKIASILKNSVLYPHDLVARYGGEEFVIILPRTDAKGAYALGQRIQDKLAYQQIPHEQSFIGNVLTLSIGISSTKPAYSDITAEKLVSQADKALYNAKENGRNKISIYSK